MNNWKSKQLIVYFVFFRNLYLWKFNLGSKIALGSSHMSKKAQYPILQKRVEISANIELTFVGIDWLAFCLLFISFIRFFVLKTEALITKYKSNVRELLWKPCDGIRTSKVISWLKLNLVLVDFCQSVYSSLRVLNNSVAKGRTT